MTTFTETVLYNIVSSGRVVEERAGRVLSLDGLRGVAFLMVFLVHVTLPLGFEQAHPFLTALKEVGWVGVPVFFILSGYLITELSLREGRNFSLRRFYARRAIRLWPLYFFAVGLALSAWYIPFLREARVGADPQWTWPLLTLTLNISLRDNWSEWRTIGAIVIFWTLAIEEQFYFFWAPILRWATHRIALIVCLTLIAASLITRFVLPMHEHPFLAYRMHTLINFGPIMMGAGLALVGIHRYRLTALATTIGLWLVGMAFMAIAIFEWPLPGETLYAGLLITAVDLVCLGLLILAVSGEGGARTLFESPALRWLGEMSYAGYVFHLPIFWFYYATVDGWWPSAWLDRGNLFCILIDVTIVLSATLGAARGWYALEAPFRRARARLRTPSVAIPAA